jgi:hypothetical protein
VEQETSLNYVTFEVHKAVTMKRTIFLDVTTCRLVGSYLTTCCHIPQDSNLQD